MNIPIEHPTIWPAAVWETPLNFRVCLLNMLLGVLFTLLAVRQRFSSVCSSLGSHRDLYIAVSVLLDLFYHRVLTVLIVSFAA